ncbi:MAG: hypothetical protein JNK87_02780 [Bryobacterales bacterium]|nr:hypothetical protein [Bryobacterales bacterium]
MPCLVVAAGAIRDEGTSYHYVPAGKYVRCPTSVVNSLDRELHAVGWPVRCGDVWTTDAPYGETASQLERWSSKGVLAVEMQAASLFAFGAARNVAVGCVAVVSNAIDHDGPQFDTGAQEDGLRIIEACARAATAFFSTRCVLP